MTNTLTDLARRLMKGANFGHVATLMPDGSPQVTPVWVDTDGTHLVFNTAAGRQKTRNLERNATVAISIADQQDPYTWVQIRGRVVEVTGDGADEHIDKMAKKYLNQDTYPFRREGERRLIVRVLPDHVSGSGA